VDLNEASTGSRIAAGPAPQLTTVWIGAGSPVIGGAALIVP
jgi:hypothetical protein